jgi:hypothetical protein
VSRTITAATIGSPAATADLDLLEAQTLADRSELVVKGTVAGRQRSFVFNKATQQYVPDTSSESPISRAALLTLIAAEDALTFAGVPFGQGARLGADRNANGVPDRDEPLPKLDIVGSPPNGVRLQWPSSASGWFLQFSTALGGPWHPITQAAIRSGGTQTVDQSTAGQPASFYRLRRTW